MKIQLILLSDRKVSKFNPNPKIPPVKEYKRTRKSRELTEFLRHAVILKLSAFDLILTQIP